jgi:hypothetical protein
MAMNSAGGPEEEIGAEFGVGWEGDGGVRGAKEVAGSVGGAVEDAGVGGSFGDLG